MVLSSRLSPIAEVFWSGGGSHRRPWPGRPGPGGELLKNRIICVPNSSAAGLCDLWRSRRELKAGVVGEGGVNQSLFKSSHFLRSVQQM